MRKGDDSYYYEEKEDQNICIYICIIHTYIHTYMYIYTYIYVCTRLPALVWLRYVRVSRIKQNFLVALSSSKTVSIIYRYTPLPFSSSSFPLPFNSLLNVVITKKSYFKRWTHGLRILSRTLNIVIFCF